MEIKPAVAKVKLAKRTIVDRYLWICPVCKWEAIGGTYLRGEEMMTNHLKSHEGRNEND